MGAIESLASENAWMLSLDGFPSGLLVLFGDLQDTPFPDVCFVPSGAEVIVGDGIQAYFLYPSQGWKIMAGKQDEGMREIHEADCPQKLLDVIRHVGNHTTCVGATTELLLSYPSLPSVCYLGTGDNEGRYDVWFLTRVSKGKRTVTGLSSGTWCPWGSVKMDVIAHTSHGDWRMEWITGLKHADTVRFFSSFPFRTIVAHCKLRTTRNPFVDFYDLLGWEA